MNVTESMLQFRGTKESYFGVEFKRDSRALFEIIVFLGFYHPGLFLAHFWIAVVEGKV